MATSINKGNQSIKIIFQQPLTSRGQNQLLYGVIPPGILSGGGLSTDGSTVTVAPLVCFVQDSTAGSKTGLRIETQNSYDLVGEVTASTPYIVLNYEWVDATNNFLDITTKAMGDLTTDDLIVGEALFSGPTIIGFDTSQATINPLSLIKGTGGELVIDTNVAVASLDITGALTAGSAVVGKASQEYGQTFESTGGFVSTGFDGTPGIDGFAIKGTGGLSLIRPLIAGSERTNNDLKFNVSSGWVFESGVTVDGALTVGEDIRTYFSHNNAQSLLIGKQSAVNTSFDRANFWYDGTTAKLRLDSILSSQKIVLGTYNAGSELDFLTIDSSDGSTTLSGALTGTSATFSGLLTAGGGILGPTTVLDLDIEGTADAVVRVGLNTTTTSLNNGIRIFKFDGTNVRNHDIRGNGVTSFCIDNGSVLIGSSDTSSPYSQRLHVEGGLSVVGASGTPTTDGILLLGDADRALIRPIISGISLSSKDLLYRGDAGDFWEFETPLRIASSTAMGSEKLLVGGDLKVEGSVKVDTISEFTSGNGVVIDGVTLKDGGVTSSGLVTANIVNAGSIFIQDSIRINAGGIEDLFDFDAPDSDLIIRTRIPTRFRLGSSAGVITSNDLGDTNVISFVFPSNTTQDFVFEFLTAISGVASGDTIPFIGRFGPNDVATAIVSGTQIIFKNNANSTVLTVNNGSNTTLGNTLSCWSVIN